MSASSASYSRASAQILADVADLPAYKGVLLDQFGVLHDGKKAYPDAIEAVAKLAGQGRKIVILSNSSRRSANTIPRLVKLGFDASCFAGAATSGELTFLSLRDRPDAWWQGLGRRCLHLTWGSRGAVSLDGLDLEVVEQPEDAEFVLAHGTEVVGRPGSQEAVPATLEEFKELLQRAAACSLPLIVANPDVVTVSGDSLVPMPGTFARWYREMNGKVVLMGKPDPIIYRHSMELLGLEAEQVVAVGDSLEHDISGAAAAGIDSVFVAGGIHAQDLGVSKAATEMDRQKLEQLCLSHSASPNYVIPFLK